MDIAQESVSEAISLYEKWLGSRNFQVRDSQREMLEFVTETLASENSLGVVEAGTGTGKTIALCAGALPVARKKKKKLVIVTATVGLQSQLLNYELSELARLDDKPVSFQVAKGRRRFVCLAKLERNDQTLRFSNSEADTESGSFGHERFTELWNKFHSQEWSGDMDAAPVPIDANLIAEATTESYACRRTACKWYEDCPYYDMRAEVRDADVVVTNYDLLLQDLLIGSQILPDPASSIYLLDEAHKLHDKTLSAFAMSLDLVQLKGWAEELRLRLVNLVQKLRKQSVVTTKLESIVETQIT